jgi:predicted amidohydrolase YtcJ
MPAFSDLHTHFQIGTRNLISIHLQNISSKEQFRAVVRDFSASLLPGEWLCGGMWDNDNWDDTALPDITWLDDILPLAPAVLYRHDLHSALCNSAALKEIGLDDSSADPAGGKLGRFADGKLNGMVYESAFTIARNAEPRLSAERKKTALISGMQLANSYGITSVVDMVESADELSFYFDMTSELDFTCDFELCFPLPLRRTLIDAGMKTGVGKGPIRLGPLKAFIDGSLGSRTALFSEHYLGQSDNFGILLDMADPPEKLHSMMKEAAKAGFALAVHAIGDQANELLLGIYAKIDAIGPKHLRHRVEHAQHLTTAQIAEFARLGLVASMQPAHLPGDACYADSLLNDDLLKTSYRINSLLKAGVKVIFNTDWPVVGLNPFVGIAAATNRQAADGSYEDGWLADEKIRLSQALSAYTATPAYARGNEKFAGKLASGYNADFIVIDQNPFDLDSEELKNLKILQTFHKGRSVYCRG